jgi:hypothetical protein
MKMKKEHYNELAQRVSRWASQYDYAKYRMLYREACLTDKRFMWDLFYAIDGAQLACDKLYLYMSDPQIETALKKIIKDCDTKYGC